jgi:hypothetical protein
VGENTGYVPRLTDGTFSFRRGLYLLFVVCIALMINLATDYETGIFPPYLTKSAAYRSIEIGMDSSTAQSILFRAGVSCPVEDHRSCPLLTFSNYWRTFLVRFDPRTGKVIEKQFGFRFQAPGMLGRLHILK